MTMHQYPYPMNIIFQHVLDGLEHLDEKSEFYDPQKAARIIRMIMPLLAFETMQRISADAVGSVFWDELIKAMGQEVK